MNTKEYRLKDPVLIVDDDGAFREALAALINGLDLRILEAASAQEALTLMQAARPFLVLADYRMAKMDGLTLCQKVRERFPETPFVLITGHADREILLGAIRAGVNDVLEKPVDEDQLRNMVFRFAERALQTIQTQVQQTLEMKSSFIEEASTILDDAESLILRLEKNPGDRAAIDSLFRGVHTIKGNSGALENEKLSTLAHELENLLGDLRKDEISAGPQVIDTCLHATELARKLVVQLGSGNEPSAGLCESVEKCIARIRQLRGNANASTEADTDGSQLRESGDSTSGGEATHMEEESVSVSMESLNSLMAVSGELIVLKNNFLSMAHAFHTVTAEQASRRLSNMSTSMGKITDRLQDEIMDVRKISLERALSKIPLLARRTSDALGKKIVLNTEGLQLRVDRTIGKAVASSLTHMIRNSIDHGIESESARRAAGKMPEGRITLRAHEANSLISIWIEDDGAGIDRGRILAKGQELGLIADSSAAKSDEEIFDLLFLPGFSTSKEISSVSGRGVGMDVVKSLISSVKGRIRVESTLGVGTTFRIDIPVPKSVVVEQSLLVCADGKLLAIPLQSVEQITKLAELRLTEVGGHQVCQVAGHSVKIGSFSSLIPGASLEGKRTQDEGHGSSVVILKHKDDTVGLIADQVNEQFEAVIRPFNDLVDRLPGFKGTTLLGDDRIAYAVSCDEFIPLALRKAA